MATAAAAGSASMLPRSPSPPDDQHPHAEQSSPSQPPCQPPPPPPPPPQQQQYHRRDAPSTEALSLEQGSSVLHYSTQYDGDDGYRYKSPYVWHVLGYLTCLNPPLTIAIALYTVLILLFVAIFVPFKWLPSSTLSSEVKRYLTPPIRAHLRLLYSRYHGHPLGGDGDQEKKGEAVVGAQRLVFVHLLAPLVAVPISAMAAIVVFAWFYTETLLGDNNEESGVEFRCFLFVVRRWEAFVLCALQRGDYGGASV